VIEDVIEHYDCRIGAYFGQNAGLRRPKNRGSRREPCRKAAPSPDPFRSTPYHINAVVEVKHGKDQSPLSQKLQNVVHASSTHLPKPGGDEGRVVATMSLSMGVDQDGKPFALKPLLPCGKGPETVKVGPWLL
jgi:hypothetical protein